MDLTGCFLGFRAVDDGPGADFVRSGREEVDQTQQGIAGFDQLVQARFGQAQFFQEDFGFVVRQFGDFGFNLGRDGDDLSAFLGGVFFDAFDVGVGIGIACFVFCDVGDVDDRLQGQEVEFFDLRQFIFCQAGFAGRVAVFQAGQDFFQDGVFDFGVLVATLSDFGDAVRPFLGRFQVGQAQFRIDRFDVADRVDGAVDVGDVRVFKAADDFSDGIGFTDVAEELVAQAFALGGTGDEAGDIDEAHDSGNCFFRFVHVGQDLDAFIRDFYDADIRFDRAEGVVCRFCAGLGNRVEQRALTDIRQADDAYFQIGTQWLNHLYLNNFKSAMRLTASTVFSLVPKAVRRR